MNRNVTDLARARRRVAEKQKLAREALRKFREATAYRRQPVFSSVRRLA